MTDDVDDRPEVGSTGARFGGARRRRGRPPPDGDRPAAAVGDASAGKTTDVGTVGARFAGRPRRDRHAATTGDTGSGPPVGGSSGTGPPGRTPPDAGSADTRPIGVVGPGGAALLPPEGPGDHGTAAVRPYVITGGRTRTARVLAVETLLSAPVPDRPAASPEHAAVLQMCAVPISVAEVAAGLGRPLGVARVLVSDLVDAGDLTVHGTASGSGPDGDLLARVLDGLRRL
jgi:hypothetical protein